MNEYYEYFGPDYQLDVKSSNTDDLNTPAYLNRVKSIVMENLRFQAGPPSVQMSGQSQCRSVPKPVALNLSGVDIPSLPIDDIIEDPNRDEDTISPDERRPMKLLDARRQADAELSDSDDEGDGGRKNTASHKEKDSVDNEVKLGVGIMGSGPSSTHAGPSANTTVARVLSSGSLGQKMDIDPPAPSDAPAAPLATIAASSAEGDVQPPEVNMG